MVEDRQGLGMAAMRLPFRTRSLKALVTALLACALGHLSGCQGCRRLAFGMDALGAPALGVRRGTKDTQQRCCKHVGISSRLVTAASTKQSQGQDEQTLERWSLMPDGRFRGALRDGLIVEFEGTLLGPEDPGVVIGPGGVRYVLGEAARNAATSLSSLPATIARDSKTEGAAEITYQVAMVAAAAVAGAIVAVFAIPGVVQQPEVSSSGVPVTRTNVTIVETRKTLPDGSQARVIDRTTRRERTVPGKAPVVTERTMRTEKVVRDDRVAKSEAPALRSATTSASVP